MAWFVNHYRCSRCDSTWEDECSSCPEDECGECGSRHMDPFESEDVTIQIRDLDGGLCSILVSPATAEEDPEYEDMRGDDGEPLIFADRGAAVAYLVANADAIAAAREAAEDEAYG